MGVALVLLLQQVITCDENSSMKLDGSQLANKIFMENDREIRGQHVINNITSSPESGYLISNSKNDIRREIQLVPETSDLFSSQPVQINLEQQRFGSRNNV